MRTGIIAGAVIVVVAVALFGALGVVSSRVSCTTQGMVLEAQTTSVASTVTTTAAVRTQQVTAKTQQVYNINPNSIHLPEHVPAEYGVLDAVIIGAYRYVYQNVALTTGMGVQVTWRANDTLDVYVFSSSQNSAFADSNATTSSPNIAGSPNSQAGSLSFHVSVNDTYYLVFFNPRNGSPGQGSQPVQLFNATGTATFQVTTTTFVTQTTSSVVFAPQLVTSTRTTTGSYQRTANLLSQIGGTACSS